jgi:hypothetical protein
MNIFKLFQNWFCIIVIFEWETGTMSEIFEIQWCCLKTTHYLIMIIIKLDHSTTKHMISCLSLQRRWILTILKEQISNHAHSLLLEVQALKKVFSTYNQITPRTWIQGSKLSMHIDFKSFPTLKFPTVTEIVYCISNAKYMILFYNAPKPLVAAELNVTVLYSSLWP